MEQQSAPRFMTVTEVADIMRVSKMTVYRLIHSGEMPAIRVGKSFRVPEAAVCARRVTSVATRSERAEARPLVGPLVYVGPVAGR